MPTETAKTSRSPANLRGLGLPMGPEEAEAMLETIWDLHDNVSDAIHALSRAHFLRTVRRRASGDKTAVGLAYVKGGGLGLGARGGDEVAALAALDEEAKSLHAICVVLEDLEDQFKCFLVSSLLTSLSLPPLLLGYLSGLL